ncbi:MAG: transcription antitermination factor NusB [Gemmataceae bacterium]
MTPARGVAVDVLFAARTANAWAGELVDDALSRSDLSPPDRRFVTQLVFGVIRRKGRSTPY